MSLAKAAKETEAIDRKIAKPYEPTPDERAALEAVRSRRKTPRVKVSRKKGMVSLSLDCPEESYGKVSTNGGIGYR